MHFNFFGAVPNLVFALFFLLVFFSSPIKNFEGDKEKNKTYQIIFIAASAGIFLDVFSFTYIGPSITLLIIIGILLKKTQTLLKNRKDNYPFVYFLPLFIIFLLAYKLLLGLYLYFLDPNKIIINLGIETIFEVIYSLLIASVLFYINKKFKSRISGL